MVDLTADTTAANADTLRPDLQKVATMDDLYDDGGRGNTIYDETEVVKSTDDEAIRITRQVNCLRKVESEKPQSDISSPVEVPKEFKCPLSNAIMIEPVTIASGQTYEKIYIKEWLKHRSTCPKTKEPLPNHFWVPNYLINELITQWCRVNNYYRPEPTENSYDGTEVVKSTDEEIRTRQWTCLRNVESENPESDTSPVEVPKESIRTLSNAIVIKPVTIASGQIILRPMTGLDGAGKKRTLEVEEDLDHYSPRMGSTVQFSDGRKHHKGSNQQIVPVMQPKHQTLSPREKVLKTLRIFRIIFDELSRDKAARRGATTSTTRVDYKTMHIILKEGKQVNDEWMIGSVPGVEVGDEVQYKAELRLIGLHFKICGGIDYMGKGDEVLATSVVASEGSGFMDKYESNVLIYSGEGGNIVNKDKQVSDQNLVNGNLALANSMNKRSEVRVIRGLKRSDKKGKHYVYDGLYVVQESWREKGPEGKAMYKFKLCRLPGQPSVDWKRFL